MSTWLTDFHFLRPLWLLGLVPLAWLWWRIRQRGKSSTAWQDICDPALLQHLLIFSGGRQGSTWLWLLALAWLLTLFALAGPTWSRQPQAVFHNLAARVLLVDLSQSMAAADLTPSRLSRARFKVSDILAASDDGQTALVVFAGDAFVVSPLTQDAATIAAMLPALEFDIMPVQGSRLDSGLALAHELLVQGGANSGQVIVITDSTAGERDIAAAKALREVGFRVSVLGVGTPQGAPIPTRDGLLKDQAGNIVIARLEEAALQALAGAGDGVYTRITVDSQDIKQLITETVDPVTANPNDASSTRSTDTWHEQGPWLVLVLLPLAALAFRRGWLLILPILLLPLPPPAHAFDWADLWQRPEQQAQRALENQDAERALQLSQEPWRRGTAAYRGSDFAEAVQSFSQQSGPRGHFNRGNALAQMGRLDEALAAYDAALADDPTFEDAKFNRDLVEKMMQEQQEQQNDQQNDQEGEQGEQNDQQQQQSDKEEQQQQSDSSPGDESQQQSSDSGADEQEQEQEQAETAKSDNAEKSEQEAQESDKEGDAEQQLAAQEQDPLSQEEQQVMEQWLRRIPDDPGGLLKNKFRIQYQRRERRAAPAQPW